MNYESNILIPGKKYVCDRRVIASIFIGNVGSRVLIFDYVFFSRSFVLLVWLRVSAHFFIAYLRSNRILILIFEIK